MVARLPHVSGTQKELDAANVYYEKLKPDCIDTSESFAERKAQREQEFLDPFMTVGLRGGTSTAGHHRRAEPQSIAEHCIESHGRAFHRMFIACS